MKTKRLRGWGLFRNRQRRVPPRLKARLKLERCEARDCPSSSIPLNFFDTTPDWTAIGPAPILNGITPGNLSTSGRVTGIAVDPGNPDRIFLTAASGGVWRSLNGGQSWTPLTWHLPGIPDDQRTLNMGAIGIAPSDPNIIYAVQGEGDAGTTGFGVLKSTDGGDTWALLGTATFAPLSTHSIAVDNLDPNIVYITAESFGPPFDPRPGGIFRTLDGGTTWTNITAGKPIFGGNIFFTDVELVRRTNLAEPNIVYAALGSPGGSLTNGIYRSINANAPTAAAVNWNLSIGGSTLLPGTGPGDIQISMSPQLPSTLYASIANNNGNLLGVYKTTDSGFNWVRVLATPNFLGSVSDYSNMIAVSPFDPNLVIVGGQSVHITRNGGTNWTDISAINGDGPHVSHHAGIFDSNGNFLSGNDGGIHKLNSPADPNNANWVSLNGVNSSNPTVTALNTVQFNSVAMHPRDPDLAIGGADAGNGTVLFNDNVGWTTTDTGIGGNVVWDFDDPLNLVQARPLGQTGGFLRFSRDGGLTWTQATTQPPNTNINNTLYVPPLVMDPSNSQRLFFGSDQLSISEDGGVTWGTTYTFPDGTTFNIPGTPSTGVPPPFGPIPITAIGIGRAGGGEAIFYVAHADGQLYRLRFNPFSDTLTVDSWVISPNVATNGAVFGPTGAASVGVITEIIVDPQNPSIVYVVGRGGIARTTQALIGIDPEAEEPVPPTWTLLNGTGPNALPDFFTGFRMQLDPKNFSDPTDDVLYVGGSGGVFQMTNPGGSTFEWSRTGGSYDPATGRGLPDVTVTQLALNTTTGILGVATYGAGMWQLQIRGLIRGQKFEDLNGNGIREVNEPGVPNVFIRLLNVDNPSTPIEIANTVTDAEGFFIFRSLSSSQLTATNYQIVEVNPPGTLQSTAPLSFQDLTEQSTFDISDPSIGWDPARVLIGNFRTTSISGVKFEDFNSNGIRDPGEPGIQGFTIFLDANNDGILDPTERSTVTDVNGNYTFTNLGPGLLLGEFNPDTFEGLYLVREDQQVGFIQTSPNPAGISLLSNTPVTGVNIGNIRIPRITGSKFEDVNGNGIREPNEGPLAGFTFTLTNLDTLEVRTVQSDLSGNVEFLSLPAGTYRLREMPLAGYTQTTADPPDFVLGPTTQLINAFAFGNFQNLTVTGTKFNDLDGDGTRDPGEPGVQGFTFQLINASSGAVLATTTSDAAGNFTFADRGPLPGGALYRIREVVQAGWIQTTANPPDVPVISGQNATVVFGNFRGVTVGGVVYQDLNNNGVRNPGEPGVPGFVIQLFREGVLQATATTAGDGSYQFFNVGPGSYLLLPRPRDGFVVTSPPNGYSFVTVSGNDLPSQDFGVRRQSITVTSNGEGGSPLIVVRDAATNVVRLQFNAYDPLFLGGVTVATGFINNDTIPDIITGAGPGGGPHVRAFDGQTGAEILGFMAYELTFTGGVYVAVGDVNGDGFDDIITGAGFGGGPLVKVFSGADLSLMYSYYAYDEAFRGGVTVATGDMNVDGKSDIATGAGPTGGPHVKVFSGADLSLLRNLFAYDAAFRGGVFVAMGDVNGDGFSDLTTGPGLGGGAHVRTFNGATGTQLYSFLAFTSPSPGFPWNSGAHVASYDVNLDGLADIIVSPGRGQGPRVRILNGGTLVPLFDFNANDPSFLGGIFVGGA